MHCLLHTITNPFIVVVLHVLFICALLDLFIYLLVMC